MEQLAEGGGSGQLVNFNSEARRAEGVETKYNSREGVWSQALSDTEKAKASRRAFGVAAAMP